MYIFPEIHTVVLRKIHKEQYFRFRLHSIANENRWNWAVCLSVRPAIGLSELCSFWWSSKGFRCSQGIHTIPVALEQLLMKVNIPLMGLFGFMNT